MAESQDRITGSPASADDSYRTDYLGVHLPVYEAIAAGRRGGWSTPEIAQGMLAQLRRALALPGAPAGGALLELGCGDGCLGALLAQQPGWRVSGVDIVPLAIELAARRAQQDGVALDLRVGDVRALPWPEASFDAVVDGHCLHCIVGADRALVLGECRRVLKSGGLLLLISMVGDPPPGMPGRLDPVRRCLEHGGVAGRHFGTPEGILAEVRQAGFSITAHWLWPAAQPEEIDDLVVAAVKP